MNESARSIPSNRGRADGAAIAARPYAPSMCSHRSRASVTSATPLMSSTMPKFVVPPVATTANTSMPLPSAGADATCAASVFSSAAPVSRPFASTGTASTSMSITRAACAIDECASALHATDPALRPSEPARGPGGRRLVPGRDQRRQVAERAALHEHPAGLRREAGQVGEPAQRLVLGVDGAGALEPGPAVDRRGADDEVEQAGRLGRRRRDEGQVARDGRPRCRPWTARRRTAPGPAPRPGPSR